MQQPHPMLIKPTIRKFLTRHQKWVIVAGGLLALLGALGLGRFSLGIMLPAMGEGLGLTYGQMGTLSTANFVGYLIAVLGCTSLNTIFGSRNLIFMGLFIIGCSMILISLSSTFVTVLALYFVTGIGSAIVNVPVMVLISIWFAPALRGRAAGICVMGNGLGILLSGHTVPKLNLLGSGWQVSWLVFGVTVLLLSIVCLFLIIDPARRGESSTTPHSSYSPETRPSVKNTTFYLCALLYFLFGFTYVIYVTFIITALIQEKGFTEQAAGSIWAWGGLVSILSGPLFGYVSDRIGRKQGLMIVYTLQFLAYLTVALASSTAALYFSIFCFSIGAFSIPTIMAALVGDLAGPNKAVSVFGFVTFVFGIGQITGPVIAGTLAEYTGSFSPGFTLAAMLVGSAAILSHLLPEKTG